MSERQKQLSSSYAFKVFERRNEAFRIMYDCVIEAENADEETAFDILCRYLKKICKSEYAAIAVRDFLDEGYRLVSIDTENPTYSKVITNDRITIDEKQRRKLLSEKIVKYDDIFESLTAFFFKNIEPGKTEIIKRNCYFMASTRANGLMAVSVIVMPDGYKIRVRDVVEAFLNMSGTILQRQVAERELHEQQTYLKTLLDSINTGVVVIDPATHSIVDMNEFCCSVLGIERNNYIGKKCTAIFNNEKTDCCKLKENGEKPILSEHTLRKPDGSEIIVQKYSRPIQRAGRKYYIESFMDITERKRMEESNIRLLDNLSAANKDLQDFAYIVSHDLKAPLRGISTISEWIYEDYNDKLDEDGREQLELLKNRVENMHNLIGGILQYSRATREGLESHFIDLNKLLAEIVDLVDPPENVAVSVQGDLPNIYADKFRIQQLFQNLISNAVKYNDKEDGRIEVSFIAGKDDICFTIRDNGMGMCQEDIENIFKIFYTVSGDKNSKESTGVGLSIVKKIVELYDGKIRVESEKGKGSEFIVTLPNKVLCSE